MTGGEETAMASQMKRRDMNRSDMAHYASVSYYAGNSSYFRGFFWYAYFGAKNRYRLK